MKEILNELIEHRSLSKETAKQVLVDLASGKFNASQTSAFMTVYMMRSITIDELQGFRDAMLELCIPVKLDLPVMDVCGTGGDSKNTFNISTLSSFVVAAAGQPVASMAIMALVPYRVRLMCWNTLVVNSPMILMNSNAA